MKIKSFEEIKMIIEKFPEASNAGYVIMPELLRIASQLGLPGYCEALSKWLSLSIVKEKVTEEEEIPVDIGMVAINYLGLPIRKIGNAIIIGIKETVELIERILAEDDKIVDKVEEKKENQ